MLDPDGVEVDLSQIRRAVGNVEDPFPQPRPEALDRARLGRVVAIEGMVALEVALDWRRMRPPGLVHDGDDLRLREDDAVWIAERHVRGDQLLAGDDHS